MVDSKDRNILGLFQEKARTMADNMNYSDSDYAMKSDSSEDSYTIDAKRSYLMKQKEIATRRMERLAAERAKLEQRRREIIFLIEAEEALIDGANRALSNMEGYDQCDVAEEAPSESCAPTGNAKYRGW